MNKESQGPLLQVIIAVLTLAGALGSALIANWDRVFPAPAALPREAAPLPLASSSLAGPGAASPPATGSATGRVSTPLLGAASAEADEPAKAERPNPTALYHVVVASMPNREAAIAQARALRAAGHPSEVVLSTAGVFGVTLGRYSRAEARERAAQAIRRGDAPSGTFVLPPERWQATVFP